MLAQVEYALGEIAAFEFAKEARSYPILADLSAVGSASFDGVGQAMASAGQLSIICAAALQWHAAPIAFGGLSVTGLSSADWAAAALVHGVLGAAGASSWSLSSYKILLAAMAAHGAAATSFEYYFNESRFLIHGASGISALSAAVVNAGLTADGQADFSAQAQPHVVAALQVDGRPSVALYGASTVNARLAAAGHVSQNWAGVSVVNSIAYSVGASYSYLASQSLANADLDAAGLAAMSPETAFKLIQYGTLLSDGEAIASIATKFKRYVPGAFEIPSVGLFLVDGVCVKPFAFNVIGHGVASWLKHYTVMPYLPPAFATVERPHEVRYVERPEERRHAEKLQ